MFADDRNRASPDHSDGNGLLTSAPLTDTPHIAPLSATHESAMRDSAPILQMRDPPAASYSPRLSVTSGTDYGSASHEAMPSERGALGTNATIPTTETPSGLDDIREPNMQSRPVVVQDRHITEAQQRNHNSAQQGVPKGKLS
jgi:hypothetical protein